MNNPGEPGRDDDSAQMNSVDQQVFYQILENTARTAEEVTHLRGDLQAVNDKNTEIARQVAKNESRIQTHDIALKVVQFVVGGIVLGFGAFVWTL